MNGCGTNDAITALRRICRGSTLNGPTILCITSTPLYITKEVTVRIKQNVFRRFENVERMDDERIVKKKESKIETGKRRPRLTVDFYKHIMKDTVGKLLIKKHAYVYEEVKSGQWYAVAAAFAAPFCQTTLLGIKCEVLLIN